MMTEREQMVIDAIAKTIFKDGDSSEPPGWEFLKHAREKYRKIAQEISNLTDSEGNKLLGIIDPDQSLPNPLVPNCQKRIGYARGLHSGQNAMVNMGFVKVIK